MLFEALTNFGIAYCLGILALGSWMTYVISDEQITDAKGNPMPRYVIWIAAAIWPYSIYQILKGRDD